MKPYVIKNLLKYGNTITTTEPNLEYINSEISKKLPNTKVECRKVIKKILAPQTKEGYIEEIFYSLNTVKTNIQ